MAEGSKAGKAKLVERSRNKQSAEEQEEVVEAYVEAEQTQGRIRLAGTPTEAQEMGIHCSPFGVIPKKHKPGKYRLILNLSAPEGNSVNDGIDRELASLSYVSVEEVAGAVAKLGRGALMAKIENQAGLSPCAQSDDCLWVRSMKFCFRISNCLSTYTRPMLSSSGKLSYSCWYSSNLSTSSSVS